METTTNTNTDQGRDELIAAGYRPHQNGGGLVAPGVNVPEHVHVDRDAVIHGGEILGGEFYGGTFHDGVYYGGEFHGGEFHDGTFHGGEFLGGVYRSGSFHGGLFRGGEFHRGVYYGGEFFGGAYNDGTFHDGEFYGGTYNGGEFGWGAYSDGTFIGVTCSIDEVEGVVVRLNGEEQPRAARPILKSLWGLTEEQLRVRLSDMPAWAAAEAERSGASGEYSLTVELADGGRLVGSVEA